MARKSNSQIRAEYVVARGLLGALGLLPRGAAVAVSVGVARLCHRLLGSLRKTGMRNLEIALPEKTQAERERLLKGTFDNLGRVLGEVSQFSKTTPAKIEQIVDFTLDEETQGLYHRVKEEKRGVLITTGHLGNWELLVFAFAALHEPIAYLARPLDNPLIEDLTVQIRTRFGNKPISKSNSAMLAIKMLREAGDKDASRRGNTGCSGGCERSPEGGRLCTVLRRRRLHFRRPGDVGPTDRCTDRAFLLRLRPSGEAVQDRPR
jgi:lauroyl/myristoyl acyltransferase